MRGALTMIAFQDFVPRLQNKRMLGMISDYENLHELVSRVNIWIEQNQIDLINLETLLVTNLPKGAETSLKTQMDSQVSVSSTYQIIRVWYREAAGKDAAYTGQTTRLSLD
jgi:hypothetical protein